MALFGTNGIRGIPNRDFYPDFYLHIALAVGSVIGGKSFAVASDGRKALAMIKGAVLSGLTATGHDVIDLGTLPVPALQYYCKMHRVPGVMVTASHNPPEYNGIKVIGDDGMEADPVTVGKIESFYYAANYAETIGKAKDELRGEGPKYAAWSDVGEIKADNTAKDLYINGILEKVDVEAIRKRGLRVLYDCSNGATYETTPMLLKELGIQGIALNSSLDSMFSGHNPEPTEDNIKDTIRIVKEMGVDFAVVHDSDGDRSVFISPEGKYLDGNYSLAIIARRKLKRGDKIVVPVNTSDILIKTAEEIGSTVYTTKVGAPLVARKA
ncbi:MAG: phosphoglucosamine mutase, partial [Candidatus Micrarchaeia archaeon]